MRRYAIGNYLLALVGVLLQLWTILGLTIEEGVGILKDLGIPEYAAISGLGIGLFGWAIRRPLGRVWHRVRVRYSARARFRALCSDIDEVRWALTADLPAHDLPPEMDVGFAILTRRLWEEAGIDLPKKMTRAQALRWLDVLVPYSNRGDIAGARAILRGHARKADTSPS